MISALNSSPTRSAMNFTFFHSTSSRSASAARRSDSEHSPAMARTSLSSNIGRLAPLASSAAQHPVNDQVRIAANRRREMRVSLGREREMPRVLLAISRLPQRTQHQVIQDALLGLALQPRDQALIVSRGDRGIRLRQYEFATHLAPIPPAIDHREPLDRDRSAAERIAEMRGDLLEVHHALRIRRLVNPVNGRLLGALDV